jgi:hypothetical protein
MLSEGQHLSAILFRVRVHIHDRFSNIYAQSEPVIQFHISPSMSFEVVQGSEVRFFEA